MKILYVCSADLSGESGSLGSVRHIMEVSENMVALGHSVTLLAPAFARYQHKTPVRIVYVPTIRLRFIRTVVAEFLSVMWMLLHLLVWRPNIVYWRQAYLTVCPVLLARLCRRRIVAEINGLTIDELESESISALRKRVIRFFERINYRFASHLICVAPQIRTRILAHYGLHPQKVSVILNGVNAERMPVLDSGQARREIGLDPMDRVIGFVGHFFPWDGLEYLIDSAVRILAREPKALFLIVGHGQWGRHLPDLAKQKGVEERFVFTGKVAWERLYLYVNAFEIAVAPYAKSINEQSGRSSLKLLEYFACEKPVVASRTSVIPEVVDLEERGLGITVTPENSTALAEALLQLMADDSLRLRLGQGGRQYVLGERSWRRVAERTCDILKGLAV